MNTNLNVMKISGKDIRIDGRLLRIARLEAERYEFLTDPAAAIEKLHNCGTRIDLFTFIQKVPHTTPAFGYPMEWDNAAAVPISTYDHWWTRQINGKTRNMVRRAETKGVVVREVDFDDSLVRGISEIYDECPIRQGRAFWHYRKGIEAVRSENGTFLDRSVFLGAFVGQHLIGFAKLVMDDARQQAALMQILSMVRHRDKSPTNALIAHAVRSCSERAIPYLVYANFSYGNKQHDSLSDFKHHNGFQRFELPRYYVPLTPIGRTAVHLGLYRGFTTHIPEPLLAQLRRMRGMWHVARLQGTGESS
jgi:hypothetical protein